MLSNLEQVIENKDTEVDLMNIIIKEQRREIRKQKTLKVIGFSSAIILPIITLFILAK